MDAINFIVVCTEKYSPEYADKSLSMFARNYDGAFTPFCITDKKKQISVEYNFIEKDQNLSGWWNKISVFQQRLPHKNTLYVDLDLLIMNPITEVLEFAAESSSDFQIACFGDHINWHGESFGSAFMFFNQTKMHWIYNAFMKDLKSNMLTEGGDQIWIGKQLSHVLYLEKYFKNFVKSLKFDIGEWSQDRRSLALPKNIEEDFLLLNCHGQPKPHQLRQLGWKPIENIWR